MNEAARAGCEHLLLLDQDSTPNPGFAAQLSGRYQELKATKTRFAAVGPLLTPPEGGDYLPIKYSRRRPYRGGLGSRVDFLPTSGSLVSVAAWRDVGPFRADYFIGGIDVEWGFRAWSKGWACVLAEDIEMVHRWGETARGGFFRPQILRQPESRVYYYIRNSVDGLQLEHMPWTWKVRQILLTLAQIVAALIVRKRRTAFAKFVVRAVCDGWRGRMGSIRWPTSA
jgi:rhamnosyltransferase